MAGHIAKKGNRYYPVVYGAINRTTGRDVCDWHDDFASRKEAERALAEIVKRKQDGDYRSPDRITLADYLNDRWLPLKKSQLSRSTFDSYRNNVRLHVAPRIGSIQLRQLQPEDLDTLYAELLIDGKLNGAGGGLAPKTVRNIHGMLRKALADAHRKGTVLRNVADLADPPKVRTGGAKDLVGRTLIRHRLNDFLLAAGGHIGYAVLPAFRRRGLATAILTQSLIVARTYDIGRVLVTCDDGNDASARVITRCGGVLEDIVENPEGGPRKRRYWIA